MINKTRHDEMRLLVKYLLRFNQYLTKADAATFAKFVQYTYQLQAVTIVNAEIISLFKALLTIIKKIAQQEPVELVPEES